MAIEKVLYGSKANIILEEELVETQSFKMAVRQCRIDRRRWSRDRF